MTGKRDMTEPNWKRRVNVCRRFARFLIEHDFQVIEPTNFDVPPSKRNGIAQSP